jgi:hypothetical protein
VNAALAGTQRELVTFHGINEVHSTTQNWTDQEAKTFYNVAQGSKLIPYSWFLHLEQPGSGKLFLTAEHIGMLGYLPRTPAQPGNPDGLPVGFVRDGDHLGLTCAACHTNQINFKGHAWLIDGAPTLGDFALFLRRLSEALEQTAQDEARFQRFAAKVLQPGASPEAIKELRNSLREVSELRESYNQRNLPKANAPQFGPGRVDAFGAIMNEVAGTFAQVPGNYREANAPVSYPFLWDTPQHDRVQWNGAAENNTLPFAIPGLNTRHIGALGRNTGEVLGVFGTVDATSAGLLKLGGYRSSVHKPNLIAIEEMLRKLWSPQWPAQFGSINPDDQLQGKAALRCALRLLS